MSSVARPRAVVFDLDGLMFNTEELYQHVGGEVLRRRGHAFTPELLDQMMGRPGHVALDIMIRWHGLNDTVAELAIESEQVFATILDERLALMPGLAELLVALEQASIPKAIATSSARRFATTVLSRFDLEPRFKFVLTAEDVVHGKPAPEIYETAARRLGYATHELLVLEDSQNGCRAAVAAGTQAVAVPAGRSWQHDFTGAALVARTLADPRIYDLLGIGRPNR